MNLRFTKMHGLGNDFVVIDLINQHCDITPEIARQLADRRFGIGCDQVLLVEPSDNDQADFRYRIFNADGGEVEQCGNGARCFARFVRDKGLSDQDRITVETASGIIQPRLQENGEVEVDMGAPLLEPALIPFRSTTRAITYSLPLSGESLEISAVSMGNPHAVMLVDNVDVAAVERLGPLIEQHADFPNRVNVGFMQVVSPEHIRLRVYERGAGETLACGTGACAAVVAGRIRGLLAERVRVDLPGGSLVISWPGTHRDPAYPVYMTGPADTVFEGQITL